MSKMRTIIRENVRKFDPFLQKNSSYEAALPTLMIFFLLKYEIRNGDTSVIRA